MKRRREHRSESEVKVDALNIFQYFALKLFLKLFLFDEVKQVIPCEEPVVQSHLM